MAGQNKYTKVSTPIRTIKSDIGQVRISLFNDQIAFNIQPAFGQKDEYGNIKYDGRPATAPNVRFSMGVAAAVSELLLTQLIPAATNNQNIHRDVFACKRKNYESYLAFDVSNGQIVMTGTEINSDGQKRASYSFPVTQIKDENGNPTNIQGEAIAMAELLREIGSSNDCAAHMKQYAQAVKDNFAQNGGGYGQQQQSFNNMQPAQPMNSWHP